MVRKPFNPFDWTVPVGALAVSPTGEALALRVGPPGMLSPPALCDPETERLTLLVPDDSARAEWLGLILTTARTLLRVHYGTADGARPTLLPMPGEVPNDQQVLVRLRRLAKLGRPLCDRAPGAPPIDPSLAPQLAEARLFFDYLLRDYRGARAHLVEVEARTTRPDRRFRLLGLRAQIELGLGDVEQARGVVAYLRDTRPRPALRIEETPLGPVVGPAPGAADATAWLDPLSGRIEALARRSASAAGTRDASGPEGPFQAPADADDPLRPGPDEPDNLLVFPDAPDEAPPAPPGLPDVVDPR
jgi:hypothetical protein